MAGDHEWMDTQEYLKCPRCGKYIEPDDDGTESETQATCTCGCQFNYVCRHTYDICLLDQADIDRYREEKLQEHCDVCSDTSYCGHCQWTRKLTPQQEDLIGQEEFHGQVEPC